MDTLITYLYQAFGYIGPFIILLGLLIFVHELGHFLVAKYYNVRVEVFSLGFGKKIFQKQWGETTYCISLIPLGGYVKMFGDDPNKEIPAEEQKHSFLHKPVGQRIAVVVAGPLMNVFFAWLVFMVIGLLGEQVASSKVGDIDPNTPAYDYGFRSGDTITKVGGTETQTWDEVNAELKERAGTRLFFEVTREDSGETERFEAGADLIENKNIFSSQRQVGGIIGITQDAAASIIGVSETDSLAAKAGLKSFDQVISVNGKKVHYWRQIFPALRQAAGESTVLEVKNYNLDKDTQPRKVTLDLSSVSATEVDQIGIERAENFILRVKEDSPAQAAGVQRGDKIVKLNGEDITRWEQILATVKSYKVGDPPIDFTVVRNGQVIDLQITPQMTELMNRRLQEEQRFTVGISPGLMNAGLEPITVTQTPLSTVLYGAEQTVHWTYLTVVGIVRLIQGEVSPRNVAGVITIGRVAGHSFKVGISAFLKVMAIISINLFILNLLPIPILDGGHLLFYTIEALRGAPLSMRKMEIAQQVGLIIMMTLMAFALFNDINNIINPH